MKTRSGSKVGPVSRTLTFLDIAGESRTAEFVIHISVGNSRNWTKVPTKLIGHPLSGDSCHLVSKHLDDDFIIIS
jgi:hypothetical protein